MSNYPGDRYSSHHEFRFGMSQDRMTWGCHILIVINILAFVGQLLLDIPFGATMLLGVSPPGGDIVRWLSFMPAGFLEGHIWRPITYMFLHAGLLHLFMNMFWLFIFGPDVEQRFGTRRFLWFYGLCGGIGVLATYVRWIGAGLVETPAPVGLSVVGASGAVMGVLIAFAMMYPNREFFIIPFPMPINARALVFILIVLNIITALSASAVSVATHFGGMGVAYVYMKVLPKWNEMRRQRRWKQHSKKGKDVDDAIGRAVDNIFKFEDFEDRKRH